MMIARIHCLFTERSYAGEGPARPRARQGITIMGSSAGFDRKASLPRNIRSDRFADDPRWLTVQRVVASRYFARSRLLSKFLLFIVAETLEDPTCKISEQQIGVRVFGRSSGYKPVEDNIVRNYARQLRRRLMDYFECEGASEPLRIYIPVGGYVPVFTSASDAAPKLEDVRVPSLDSIPARMSGSSEQPGNSIAAAIMSVRRRWDRLLLAALLFAVYSSALVSVGWLAARRVHPPRLTSGPAKPLWDALFGGPANCYIVPADVGINLIESLSHRPIPLELYIKGDYLNQHLPLPQVDAQSADNFRSQQLTDFIDMQIVAALARLPEFNPEQTILRFPRDLRLDEVKNANVVILGSVASNPWAAIAQSNANFRIINSENMTGATIVNTKPQPGEAKSYGSEWNQPAHETFATITYVPNLGGNGHLLLVQGLDVAGTQAAAEALIHPVAITPILQRATRPDGSLRSFEILLRSTSIVSKSETARVIGSRIY